ncbi:MAG: type ISP restriction/modification enzyme [Patescibacteria group bacterium]
MKKLFENYIESIASKFSHEETSEMGYRADFEILLKGIFESIKVKRIDHDARAKQGNKPDFVVLNNDVLILYIEAKDIGVSLDKVERSEQMARYYGYANLVLTDYVEFRFYRNGIKYEEPIKIANYNIKSRTISSIPENYEHVAKSLIDFAKSHKEPIRSGKHLAKIMGGKAQRIRDNTRQFLATQSDQNSDLTRVYETIKRLLVHDLTLDSFADMYAQTLVYGLFVARYHDETPGTFSRQEARDLIPASNPFLGHFFDHIAGRNFEKRLAYIVDELCEVFTHADVQNLMKEYFKDDLWGETHRGPDPVIHFYEDFLKEYDEALRKKMGAYYTPLPVVQFIVRSVDYLLEKEFGLASGLADTSKTTDGLHRVQILDPAVGTGTFISNVINQIYIRILKNKQQGRWPTYVHHDLLPRLHGFELMMAPYTIAHLKISMALKDTGFMYFNETRTGKARLGVYLTNSLEEVSKQPELLAFDFAASIAEEAKEASKIKNEKPIMVVVGNPPYSVSSPNKGDWIQNLVKVYKVGLVGEKNIQPLSDDYIKFIRLSEHFIEKNKSGIVAMITNNSFLDGRIHRQMRKHLLETFDDIYVIDLHGNSKRQEVTPDGGKDENVFDIQQGVSINIFVRRDKNKNKLGTVYHSEFYGSRDAKFEALNKSAIDKIKWKKLDCPEPYFFFVPKDFREGPEYGLGFSLNDLFNINSSGIQTKRDDLFIDYEKTLLENRIIKLLSDNFDSAENIAYNIADSSSFKLINKISKSHYEADFLTEIMYRPFDKRWIYYDENLLGRPFYNVMRHMTSLDNISLISCKQQSTFNFQHAFVAKTISGSDTVDKISYREEKVFINADQYFGDVPEVAWNFYIGGYQPAQKWLKDRKGRTLTNEDIEHYQKMIVALMETDRIMKEIDLIKI